MAVLGLSALLLAPAVVRAEDAAVSKKSTKAPKKFPISGAVGISTTVGLGTFVPGPQNRASWSSGLSLQAFGSPAQGVTLMYLQDINKTFVDNYGALFAPRANETFVSDPVFLAVWSPYLHDDDGVKKKKKALTKAEAAEAARQAALNPLLVSGGDGHPLALPGDIRVSFVGILTPGLSRISRFRSRYATVGLAVNLTRRFGPVTLAYRLRGNKHFHKYTNPVVDTTAWDQGPVYRTGGAEDLGNGLMADSFQNASFFLRNRLLVSWTISETWTFQGLFRVSNLFNYYSAPVDEYSAPQAKGGRGRLDTQLGLLSLTWSMGAWMVSGTATTWSVPFTANNDTYRFPFWDFVSASDNITTMSLSLTRLF